MTSSATRLLALLTVALALPACTSLEMSRLGRDVAGDIERHTDAEVEAGYAIGFGRMSIGTSRFLARAASPGETREARELMRHVRRVLVGRYPIRGAFDGRSLPAPSALRRYEGDGWFPFVTVRDSASAAWVLVREDPRDGRLTDVLTVVAAEDDLVLTKVSGDLNRLVLEAVRMGGDRGLFDGAFDHAGLTNEPTGGAAEPEEPLDEAPPEEPRAHDERPPALAPSGGV